ncbi:hypothetical protein GGS24DRAFT_454601 [Hypoxylon argillaceum]|nr:hypothetical protein GGS24DRAFT_454601 [Hypoxylon argillaceum]
MVIHSIEGGCPARNQKGNLDGPNQDKYTFQIPEGIEPGTNYTLAWTWANRISGGPEFYMNCAPITILPSSKKRMSPPARRGAIAQRAAASFPELFMANLGELTGGCTTNDALREQISISYPDPGTSIDRPEGGNLFKQPCDGNPRARGAVGGGEGNGTSQTTSSISSGLAGSSSVLTRPSSVPTTSTSTSTSSRPTETDTTSAVVVTSTPTVTPFSTASALSTSTSTSTPGSYSPLPSGAAGQCTEGYLTCLGDGTHFATCTGGQLTGPQPIAPGFKCRPGEGVGLDISPM